MDTKWRNFTSIHLPQKGFISQKEHQFVKHSRTWHLGKRDLHTEEMVEQKQVMVKVKEVTGSLQCSRPLRTMAQEFQVTLGNQKGETFIIYGPIYGKLLQKVLPRELKVYGRCRCLRKQSSLNIRLPLTQNKQTFYQTSSSCLEWHTSATHRAHRSSWWKHRRSSSWRLGHECNGEERMEEGMEIRLHPQSVTDATPATLCVVYIRAQAEKRQLNFRGQFPFEWQEH